MAGDTPRRVSSDPPITVEQAATMPMAPNTARGPTPSPPDGAGLVPGMPFGPYEIVDRLGSGGMGEVFRASYPMLGRDVALKVLRNDLHGTNPEARQTRLLREARAMARLAHAKVVTVFDAGEIGGQV